MSTSFFKENKHEINKDENNYNINKKILKILKYLNFLKYKLQLIKSN